MRVYKPRLTVIEREFAKMWNGYQPYRRSGIRFFPHIIPIAFPLIFPFGVGLLFGLFHLVLPLVALLVFAGLIFFIIRVVMLGSPDAAWNSMRGMGTQWQQRFTAQQQPQQPYYQPQQPYYQPTEQGNQPQQPYYQPSSPVGQGYQAQQPYYRPTEQSTSAEQPKAHYPEQMPPMQQQ